MQYIPGTVASENMYDVIKLFNAKTNNLMVQYSTVLYAVLYKQGRFCTLQ